MGVGALIMAGMVVPWLTATAVPVEPWLAAHHFEAVTAVGFLALVVYHIEHQRRLIRQLQFEIKDLRNNSPPPA